jgi:hypothetical protein
MKNQLSRRLYAFIITIAIGVMFSATASAQFVYTDVNPDVAVTCTASTPNNSCSAIDSIDINNDGVFDLKIRVGGSSSGGIHHSGTQSGIVEATPLHGSSIISNTSGYPHHLYRNDSIKSTNHWTTAANRILESLSHASKQIGNTVSGNWTHPIDGYLGIKIVSEGQINYGWIRLNVTINLPTASCMYKEYAYNSIPNQPILAGQISNPIVVGPIVNIPDPAFKSTLVNNAAINTDIDREIQVTEATAFTGGLFIFGTFISNLTGLEAFTAIDTLYVYGTAATSLDVTSNTALIYLNCSYNKLTSIDVSANTALTGMYCYYNQLTSLDVSSNMDLSILYTGNNLLTSLNFSNNLEFLDCEYNQLTSLDVSANAALWDLVCNNNQLTSLNVKNGNNSHFWYFSATGNPNLSCIQVDNVAYSNWNWSAGKDATASFSTNCGTTSVPDNRNLSDVQIFPNPAVNHFTIDLGSNTKKVQVTIADIAGKVVYTTIATDTQRLELTTNDFAKGIYVVQIQTAEFLDTRTIIVDK